MKKLITFLLVSFLITTKLWAVTYPIDATGKTAAQINTSISAALPTSTDITLQFPRGVTYNYAATTLTIPATVTKLTFTAIGSGTMPIINLDQLNFSDGLMTDGLFFEGVKLYATSGTSKFLFQPTTSATNIPAKLSINNCWIEGYKAVVLIAMASTVSNITLTNSTFYNTGNSGIISTSNVASVISNISITNNTFIDCNLASCYFIDHRTTNSNSTTLNFSNNTLYLSAAQGNPAFRLTTAPTTVGHYTFNNNIFSGGSAVAFKFGYGNYANISGTGNYYIQSFTGTPTNLGSSTGVTITQYNVTPASLFTSPGTSSSANFTINDLSFAGKVSAGNSNCFYPETVNITGGSIVNLDYNLGTGPSTAKTFTISTIVLRGAITLTAPTHYEISTDNSTFSGTLTLGGVGSDLTNQTIYVRLKAGLGVATYSESITVSTALRSYASVACSGSVTNVLPVLDTPTGLSSSTITYTGFHASWSSVTHASSYTLRVLLNGSTATTIPGISGTSYDVTGLTPGGNYTFAVTAIGDAINYNSSVESSQSGSIALPYIYLFTSINNASAGTVTKSPSSATYASNASVNLTATKNFGYVFVNWVDSVSGSVLSSANPYTVTMDGTKHIKAVFNIVNTYKLSLDIVGGAKSYMVAISPSPTIVSGNNMYEDGTVVTLTASSNSILTFSNWSNASTNSVLSLTMNQDQTTTATYSAADYIVGWDFYTTGNTNRPADFYSTSDNSTSTLITRNAAGTTSAWLDKSIAAASGYYGRGAAVNWKNGADLYQYYYQTNFVTTDFTNIKVKAGMLYNYNAYSKQNCQYSLDGTTFTTVGTYTLSSAQVWVDSTFTLPAECNHASRVYVRWIADNTSSIVGTTGNDGTSLSAVYITGTRAAVNDGLAPSLSSSVPTSNGTGASATGKVVLNFSKNVQVAGGTTATLGSKTLSPTVSGKTITFSYSGLNYNTSYTFTLAAGTVSDAFGNTLSSPVSFSFTTMTRPAVTKKAFDFVVGVNGNFAAALAAANTASASGNRYYIFFPNGQYNIGSLTGDANQMTTIAVPKVSYVGQNADSVVVYNLPTTEGISSTATFKFTSTSSNNYMQDISLLNKMDYRIRPLIGRAAALMDQGNKNIYKNIKLLSNQDTYYSGATIRSYFENCEIHGTVDYLCGGGDIFFNECTLYMEDRTGNNIVAPATTTSYGYVFNNCTIDGFSSTNGNYTLGRPWQASPRSVFINTTMKVLPTAAGWTEMGVVPALFAEYNSINSVGATVDLSMRKSSYTYNSVTTPVSPQVLTAEQAATYTVDNVVGGSDAWVPQQSTDQAGAPAITGSNRAINWDNNDYVLCWGVFKNGAFVQFVTTNIYTIPNDVPAGAVYTVRAANEMGGLSAVSNTYTLALTTTATDNFRSKATGNSTDLASWESSSDNSNWISATSLPTVAAASVTILNGHTISVNSNLNLLSLTLNSGSTMTVNSTNKLTVANSMTNNGTLNLLSDASGTATILTPATISGSGTSNVQQYLTSSRNWYVSSPVTGATSAALDASNSIVYWYNEALATWPQITNNTTDLDAMKGYVVNPVSTGAITFSGSLNTGSKSITIYRSSGQTKEGFNLVGNPYASFLDWSQVSRGNAMSTLWYRTKNAESTYVFDTYNALGGMSTNLGVKAITNMVPPMQAFWVRVANGQTQATISVSNAQRGHADVGTNGFKVKSESNTTQQVLRMEVSNGMNTDQALIYSNPNAMNSFDDYDSPKMFNNSAAIAEIYTLAGNEDLAINGLNTIPYDSEIPLGFSTSIAGTFSLKASQISNFAEGPRVLLKDYAVGINPVIADLSDGSSYTFTSGISSNNSTRFTLVFRAPSVTTGINKATNGTMWISTKGNNLIINGVPTNGTTLEVFNAIGQKIVSKNLNSVSSLTGISLQTGIYMVTVIQNEHKVTQKIIVD